LQKDVKTLIDYFERRVDPVSHVAEQDHMQQPIDVTPGAPTTEPPAEDLIPLKAWLILALLTIESIIGIIDRQSIGVLKATLKGEFQFGDLEYSYLVNAFLIPYAIFYIICGSLVDRFGSRRVLST
jgi:hypothetical protein